MPLKKPNEEDKRKLHGEVNQLVNQRFLLSTLAVTAFGVIAAWIMKEPTNSVGEVGWFRYLGSSVLIIVLFALFYLMHRLRAMLRIISSYLLETGSSGWETDWKQYREKRYASYTKAQTWLFIVLGILATILPFTLAFAYKLTIEPYPGATIVALMGGVYVILLIGMGFGNWFDSEDQAQERWHELNALKKTRKKKMQ